MFEDRMAATFTSCSDAQFSLPQTRKPETVFLLFHFELILFVLIESKKILLTTQKCMHISVFRLGWQ